MAVGRHLGFFQFRWVRVAEISDLSVMNKCNLDWNGPWNKPGGDQWADWTITAYNCWSEPSGKKGKVSLRTFTKLSRVLPLDTAPLLNKLSPWNKPNVHLTHPTPLAGQSKKGEKGSKLHLDKCVLKTIQPSVTHKLMRPEAIVNYKEFLACLY